MRRPTDQELLEYWRRPQPDDLAGCRGFANAILYTSAFAAAIGIALLIVKLLTAGRIP